MTDTERLDWLERDAGKTVYPHDSFEGKSWAVADRAYASLRIAIDDAVLDAAVQAWKDGGRVGSPPPHSVAPHTPGWKR